MCLYNLRFRQQLTVTVWNMLLTDCFVELFYYLWDASLWRHPLIGRHAGRTQVTLPTCSWRRREINNLQTPNSCHFRWHASMSRAAFSGILSVIYAEYVAVGTREKWRVCPEVGYKHLFLVSSNTSQTPLDCWWAVVNFIAPTVGFLPRNSRVTWRAVEVIAVLSIDPCIHLSEV